MAGNLQRELEVLNQINFKGKYPKIDEDVFIAPGVKLIGDVRLKKFFKHLVQLRLAWRY